MLGLELDCKRDLIAPRRGPQPVRTAPKDAARLIHDLNNALTVVLTTSALLCSEIPAQSPLAPDVQDIFKQARAAADLVQQLSQQLRVRSRKAAL